MKKNGFLSAFLLTENGRPKSSLLLYTFCLSIADVLVYILSYYAMTEVTHGWVAALPAVAGNLVTAVLASLLGAVICCLPGHWFRDKRLVPGGHFWLILYSVLSMIVLLYEMWNTDAMDAFFLLFAYTVVLPVTVGTLLSVLQYRRQRRK